MSRNSVEVNDVELWHQRLGHVNHNDLERLSRQELVRGLSKLEKPSNNVCGSCDKGKQIRVSHKNVDQYVTNRPLELLHMDLMAPT